MEKGNQIRKTTLMFNSSDNPETSQIRITIDRPSPARNLFKKINNWEAEENNKSVFYDSKTSLDINKKRDFKEFITIFKIMSLVIIWAICSYSLMANNEKVQHTHQISIPKAGIRSYLITKKPKNNLIRVSLEGALLPSYYGNLSTEWMSVWVQLMVMREVPTTTSQIRNSDILLLQNVSDVWYVPLVTEQLIGHVPEVEYDRIFHLSSHKIDNVSYHLLRLQFSTNLKTNFPVSMGYNVQPIDPEDGIIYAALVLVGLYILIIFEIIHRTLAGMLASTMSLAILAALNERPTMGEIISWIDMETLILLFSMMVLVAIFSDTGIFDYAAVFAYKKTGGKLWPLINLLCILTTVLACFLDNVTTALLLTPITIKLCEVMNLNPKLILMYTLLFANIGGALTPIGDPPNVVIASNPDVIESGVNFGVFTMHMGIGVFLALTVVYIQIRIIYKDMKYYQYDEPPQVEDLKREIAVWERTAASVSSYSKDEGTVKDSLLKKTVELKGNLRQTVNNTNNTEENYKMNVEDLEKKYPIRNRSLLVKSGVTLFLVICVFFLHSIPALSRLGLGWTALLGSLLLFLLYDTQDLEGVFSRVEWSTLLFFASLFILMEALSRLGLIDWIGKQTQYVITSVGPESRLATAIVLILWVSAIASAFVDNLPLTTMMIRIAVNLASNSELHLPLQPLVWALSFGACLGGNGTLIGSSSNIVCAGLAEQHGHRFTFMQFLKVGLPAMLSSIIVVTMYLIVCHVIMDWH